MLCQNEKTEKADSLFNEWIAVEQDWGDGLAGTHEVSYRILIFIDVIEG